MTPLQRARGAIGTRFRLHGRGGAEGIDCVGLAALAYTVRPPRGYDLRTGDPIRVFDAVSAAGLTEVSDERPGDLILFLAGPGQLHLGIASERGVIHADASLRRVVERPGVPPWPILKRWRKE
jgi:cell wall-associated NlpC family hydrolase